MSETCNNNNLKMKLDMRLMMDGSNHITYYKSAFSSKTEFHYRRFALGHTKRRLKIQRRSKKCGRPNASPKDDDATLTKWGYGSNCEYAAKPTNSKLYKDKLKLVLGGYSYIKQIIESCPHLNEKDIVDIKIPYLQIMGFRAVVSIIRLHDKGLLITEDLINQLPFHQKMYSKWWYKPIDQGFLFN